MSILTAIRNHSRRGYYAAQALIIVGAASPLATALLPGGLTAPMEAGLAALSLAAVAAGLFLLHYLRASLRLRLDEASRVDAERQKLYEMDALTGALSRREFLRTLQQRLGNPIRPNAGSLLLVDIDHFKALNDSFGHPAGDAVLTYVVDAVRACFPGCPVGRRGGDEFALFVSGDTIGDVEQRADRLLRMLAQGMPHEAHNIELGVSMGAATSPDHASQPKDLMLLADLALYESKSRGRSRLTVFDPDMLSEKRHRRFIERELRAAIYLNQLELHYQPVINADGSAFGVEGLVRWRHPVRGLISPGEFVPIAERSGLIDALGAWVFRRACLDAEALHGLRVSINVSGQQLKNAGFVPQLRRILDETGCHPSRLVIEITETAAMSATPEIIGRIEELRSMGLRVALDDFGTGHCGFNYLKTLPIDSIKIDRSYIQTLASDHIARIFVSAVAEIGRVRELTVLAEGVETAEEFQLAKAAGCTRFQGYLFARPAPLRDTIDNLAAMAGDDRAIA